MKTIKLLLKSGLVLTAALALAACGSKTEETTAASSSEETATATWKDGTYTAESDFDERGWKFVHEITIKDGKITESVADYEDKDGNLKSENAEYNTMMEEKSGISSKDATDKLDAALLEAQDAEAVEVVSGATHTAENFKKSAAALLAAAEKGNTETIKLVFE